MVKEEKMKKKMEGEGFSEQARSNNWEFKMSFLTSLQRACEANRRGGRCYSNSWACLAKGWEHTHKCKYRYLPHLQVGSPISDWGVPQRFFYLFRITPGSEGNQQLVILHFKRIMALQTSESAA